MSLAAIAVATFRAWLDDGQELAVLDLRDEAAFAKGAPLYATNLPAERVEREIAHFVPHASVRTVLVDDGSGVSANIAERLAQAGRLHVFALAGGIPAWTVSGAADRPTFDTPDLAFSVAIRDERGIPVVSTAELAALREAGPDELAACDRAMSLTEPSV